MTEDRFTVGDLLDMLADEPKETPVVFKVGKKRIADGAVSFFEDGELVIDIG